MRLQQTLFIVISALILSGCSGNGGNGKPGVPVYVGISDKEDVPIYAEALARLLPSKKAKIIAKVNGELLAAPITEGTHVNEGDLLFEIDCDVYSANLQKAEAWLKQSQADLEFSKKKQNRYLALVEKEYVTPLSLEELEKEVADNVANVATKEADVELAKIDLDHCRIQAPISGIIGEQKVGTKNYVDAGTLLTTIVQIDELDVEFHLPERFLVALHEARQSNESIPIVAYTQFDQRASGHLVFVDNEVDPETGTILLRGTVPNEERELEAGQFARVKLQLKLLKEATVIPPESVQIGQEGMYIYTVNTDQTVQLVPVEVVLHNNNVAVITNDLPKGTQVITDGHLNLYPGAKVSIKKPEGSS